MWSLSASSVLNYAKCPYSFYLYKTYGKEERPLSKATATGKAFHKVVELILNGANFKEALGEIVASDGVLVDFNELKLFYTAYEREIEKIKNEGVLAVEKPFELEIDDVIITGYIDIITNERRMIEMKTTRQHVLHPKPSHLFQLSLYRLTDDADYYELHYIMPNDFVKIPVKPYPTDFVLTVIKQVKKLVNTEEYPPLGIINGYCQFCLFKDLCSFYNRLNKSGG
jgi:RecB family exonuclease